MAQPTQKNKKKLKSKKPLKKKLAKHKKQDMIVIDMSSGKAEVIEPKPHYTDLMHLKINDNSTVTIFKHTEDGMHLHIETFGGQGRVKIKEETLIKLWELYRGFKLLDEQLLLPKPTKETEEILKRINKKMHILIDDKAAADAATWRIREDLEEFVRSEAKET